MTNKTLENLNIRFTSKEADNESIIPASNSWTRESISKFIDISDCIDLLLQYATDRQAIFERLNIEFWFD